MCCNQIAPSLRGVSLNIEPLVACSTSLCAVHSPHMLLPDDGKVWPKHQLTSLRVSKNICEHFPSNLSCSLPCVMFCDFVNSFPYRYPLLHKTYPSTVWLTYCLLHSIITGNNSRLTFEQESPIFFFGNTCLFVQSYFSVPYRREPAKFLWLLVLWRW